MPWLSKPSVSLESKKKAASVGTLLFWSIEESIISIHLQW